MWALLSRLTRRRAHWIPHLNIVLAGSVARGIVGAVLGTAAFALDAERAGRILGWVAGGVLMGWGLGAHLHFILRRPSRQIWSLALTILLSFGALAAIGAYGLRRLAPQAKSFPRLYPAFFLIKSPPPPDKHLALLDTLRKHADKAAAKVREEGGD
jgi:hypothetical protein